MTRYFRILGSIKTATSSVVAMLNCHPEILCLYEVQPQSPIPTKYGSRILREIPELRPCFGDLSDPLENLRCLQAHLMNLGKKYAWIGDKSPRMSIEETINSSKFDRIIFCVRDVRTWLAKNSVQRYAFTEHNIVPAAIDYTKYFLNVLKLSHDQLFVLQFEDFLQKNSQVSTELLDFLEVDNYNSQVLQNWWAHTESAHRNDPIKQSMKFLESHPSSTIKPVSLDTEVVLNDCSFWDQLLPIFDRYYFDSTKSFSHRDIDEDIELLESMRSCKLSITEAYQSISSQSFSPKIKTPLLLPLYKISRFLKKMGKSCERRLLLLDRYLAKCLT